MNHEQYEKSIRQNISKDIIKGILCLLKDNNIINDYKLADSNGITSILLTEIFDIITDNVSAVNITDKKGKDIKNKVIKSLVKTAEQHIKNLLPINIKIYAIITAADMKNYAIISNSGQIGERIRQVMWDAQRIKQYAFANYCFFLHTPGKKTDIEYKQENVRLKKQFNNYISVPNLVNSLDDVLSEEDFFWKFANIFISSKTDDGNSGQLDDARGKVYEIFLAIIFRFQTNWMRWNGEIQSGGFMYNTFNQLMKEFIKDRDNQHIEDIQVDVGKDIPELLPSDNPDSSNRTRKPKTDVCIKIRYKNETEYTYYTISAKCSSAENVSAHEYKAYDFIQALDLGESEQKLIDALNDFEKSGTISDMTSDNPSALRSGLIAHKEALYKWVITGDCVNPDRYPYIKDRKIQLANYLVCYNPKTKETLIHTSQDYIDFLLHKKINKNNRLGIPLSFTYPSGGKGDAIQIKIPLKWHTK